ncbi:MAG: hypothetical protein ACFE9Q_03095 [Candidatus Hodarchaeota archaeon]
MSIFELLEIDRLQIVKKQKILKDYKGLKNLKFVLHSGAKNFDETLGGGFYQGRMYLIFGANKTGKTQICHQLCVQAYIQLNRLLKKSNTMNNQFIFYFDTENTFRPERLKELTLTQGVEYNNLLKNIFVSKIMSNSALLLSLKELERLLELKDFNILIIDTINNHFNSEVANKEISIDKTKLIFLKILSLISELTIKYGLITIATAQVTSNLFKESLLRVIPVGNYLLNHFFSEYVFLDYKEHDKRYVQLVNSMNFPEKRILYKITPLGVQDYII